MSMLDIKKVMEEAKAEVSKEKAEKAKKALVAAYKKRDLAQDVVRNCDREIEDLEKSISDGSFVG